MEKKFEFVVQRLDENIFVLFPKGEEQTYELYDSLEKVFKIPKSISLCTGLMANIKIDGIKALKFWSDYISSYVFEPEIGGVHGYFSMYFIDGSSFKLNPLSLELKDE